MKAITIDEAVLRRLWRDRVHAEDIAAICGVSKHAVFKAAQNLGLPPRGRGIALSRMTLAELQSLGAAATARIEAPAGGAGHSTGGAVPRGLNLEQAVALDGATWAGRARLAERFGVSTRQVEQAWHWHRADPRARRAG
jgi:hypothetical protein